MFLQERQRSPEGCPHCVRMISAQSAFIPPRNVLNCPHFTASPHSQCSFESFASGSVWRPEGRLVLFLSRGSSILLGNVQEKGQAWLSRFNSEPNAQPNRVHADLLKDVRSNHDVNGEAEARGEYSNGNPHPASSEQEKGQKWLSRLENELPHLQRVHSDQLKGAPSNHHVNNEAGSPGGYSIANSNGKHYPARCGKKKARRGCLE